MCDQEVYKIGGRKFGFVSVPPLGCLPGTKILEPKNKGACFGEVTSLAKLHNRGLPKVLKILQTQLKGFNYSKYDLYTSISERLEDPLKYGKSYSNVLLLVSSFLLLLLVKSFMFLLILL